MTDDFTLNQAGGSDPISALSSLLSSPETLSKMSEIIERHSLVNSGGHPPQSEAKDESFFNNSDIINGESKDFEDSSPTVQNEDLEKKTSSPLNFLSVFSSMGLDKIGAKNDERTALLLAIRPFLSERRREMIDSFISIGKIASVFKNIS